MKILYENTTFPQKNPKILYENTTIIYIIYYIYIYNIPYLQHWSERKPEPKPEFISDKKTNALINFDTPEALPRITVILQDAAG